MINIVDLILTLLATALSSAKANNVAQEVVAELEAAVAALKRVQGTPVTYGQLESLRIKPQW